MSINYAELIGRVVKIGMQKGNDFTRHKQYRIEVEQYAWVFGVQPVEIKRLWFKQEQPLEDAIALEAWMIKELRPYTACGREWFHANPDVLKFIGRDPFALWTAAGIPGSPNAVSVKKHRVNTQQDMENLIIKAYRKNGRLTRNQCNRAIHPSRRGINGASLFAGDMDALIESGILAPCGSTQRALIYRLSL